MGAAALTICYAEGVYQLAVFGGQVLLISGMAALFSRIIYGPLNFGRRTLLVLLAGSLILPFLGTVAVLVWALRASEVLLAVLAPLLLGAIAITLLFCAGKSEKWNIQAEAARWQTERSETSPRGRKWRTRAIRLASCIPALAVLLVFLFLPEAWGILSHVGHPRAGNLPGYRVEIPTTWIVWYKNTNESNGEAWVTGYAGRGIGFGINPLTHWGWLSHWHIGTAPFNQSQASDYDRWTWTPTKDEIRNQRIVTIAGERLTCLESVYSTQLDFASYMPPIEQIMCSGSGRLYASFAGTPNQIPTFYQMLDHIRSVK